MASPGVRWQRPFNELTVVSRVCACVSGPTNMLFALWACARGSSPVIVFMHTGRDLGHALVASALEIGGAFGRALVATALYIFLHFGAYSQGSGPA